MKYTRSDCIDALQQAAEEMGEPLGVRDYRESGHSPSDRTIHKRFGSWHDALDAAGLEESNHGKNKQGIREPLTLCQSHGHEYFRSQWDGNHERVEHHRLLAVIKYGFDAVTPEMDVHHKNGIPWDNRLENLELLSHAEHRRVHGKQQNLERDEKGRIVG